MNTFSNWHQYNTRKSVTKPSFTSRYAGIAFDTTQGGFSPRGTNGGSL